MCRPPFWGRFSTACSYQVEGSQGATCCLWTGCQWISIVGWGSNEEWTLLWNLLAVREEVFLASLLGGFWGEIFSWRASCQQAGGIFWFWLQRERVVLLLPFLGELRREGSRGYREKKRGERERKLGAGKTSSAFSGKLTVNHTIFWFWVSFHWMSSMIYLSVFHLCCWFFLCFFDLTRKIGELLVILLTVRCLELLFSLLLWICLRFSHPLPAHWSSWNEAIFTTCFFLSYINALFFFTLPSVSGKFFESWVSYLVWLSWSECFWESSDEEDDGHWYMNCSSIWPIRRSHPPGYVSASKRIQQSWYGLLGMQLYAWSC